MHLPVPAVKIHYVALGDSYSSGEGNPPFDPGTNDPATGDTCHRSLDAWPYVVQAGDPKLTYPILFACSGAHTINVTTKGFKTEPSQIQQLKALHTKPGLITITIGGNNFNFADVLKDCAEVNCESDGVLPGADRYIRNYLGTAIVNTLKAIKAAAPQARLILVGYPNFMNLNVVNAQQHCAWLGWAEGTALVQAAKDLNSAEKTAAQSVGADWISMLNVLKGHELCTEDSYIRSLTLGGGQNRGHPLVPGQNAMAARVISYLQGIGM